MRVRFTATAEGRSPVGCDLNINFNGDPGAVDYAGRELARLLLQAIGGEQPEIAPDPMHGVFRELLEDHCSPLLFSTTTDDAIDRLARKHGGDSPDLLAARIRAIVGGGE